MPIAYSQRTILKATIRADTSAHFRSDVDAALLNAGWSVVRTVTNGKVYACVPAPVSTLRLHLLVQDQGTGSSFAHWIVFQAMSVDELSVGLAQTIAVATGGVVTTYQAIVGCSQFFISIPGRVSSGILDDQSGAFACGVPSLPQGTAAPGCSTNSELAATTDEWWSCGDGNGLAYAENFRSGPRCFNAWSACRNGVVTFNVVGNDPFSGMLGLWFLSPADNIDAPFYTAVPVTTYGINTPLVIDALFGWQYLIRGQLWDAFQKTGAQALDSIGTYQDRDIYGRGFTFPAQVWSSSFYSSLLLLTESPNAGSTGAYIYGGGARG